jgi:DNA-binding response OmpR family regulator
MMMKSRVLLIEDDIRLASGIVQYLELNDILCDHSIDGKKAVQLAQQNSYDVFITDITMPHMSGLEFCSYLRNAGFDTPVIMITSLSALDDKEKGFDAGADDYLVKPFALKELLMRVNALSKRKSNQATVIKIDSLGLELDCSRHKVKRNTHEIILSKSSWTLLLALVRAWPNPLSKQDLEFALWGDELRDSDGLKVHIHHLRQRLDQPFAHPLVHAVRGVGFVLALPHD